MHKARALWSRYEPIHAVTYFSPHSMGAAKTAGLKGFWMGYFGFRAAPLGPVEAGVVEATFANFAVGRVRRSVPDVWGFAPPERLIEVRREAAAVALREVDPDVEAVAAVANPLLQRIVDDADRLGRPLFAANAALAPADDPVEQLWQLCTSVREHRGDGHVAVLASEGVSGPEAHLLLIADNELDEEMFLMARGFEPEEWSAAKARLGVKGLLVGSKLTQNGKVLRSRVEARTDHLAGHALNALNDAELAELSEALEQTARAVHAAGILPPTNPIGVVPL